MQRTQRAPFHRRTNFYKRIVHSLKPNAWRACATTLTNYEICGILSVLSGLAPLPREHIAEYVRAFAHCFEFGAFMEIFGHMSGDPINLHDVERFYQLFGGRKGFGYLDDRERKWIQEFNRKARAWRETKSH